MDWQLMPQHPPLLLLVPSALVPAGCGTQHDHLASWRRGWPCCPEHEWVSALAAEQVTRLFRWCTYVLERLVQVSRAGSS